MPLLETKLYAPKWRAGHVSRPRLVERLNAGADRKLTLIAAPAGFGKTTLLAEWLAGRDAPAAWISLDASENEPVLFWSYFIAALQKIDPAVGMQALSLLYAPQSPSLEPFMLALINDIDACDVGFLIILDDYHVIEDATIHSGMTFLLEHLPRRMRVVIASRAEPRLPVSKLRAKGELVELRPADLRFNVVEATSYLNDVMSLDLQLDDLEKLEARTEGWITGLKLAALSMQGRDNSAFVEAFAGDNRYIADYLIDEVLLSQPDQIREFLLDTAMLERLSGPLCDAVTGNTGSQALLDGLERRNLFVVALDDRREWYRYHHLFADVLLMHATRRDPDRVRLSHLRASEWFQQNGETPLAVQHAVRAGDLDRAADLLEVSWPENDRSYRSAHWLARVKTLPEAIIRARPVLNTAYAWGLLNNGELEAAELRLGDVATSLESAASLVIADRARFDSLPTQIATARVYIAQTRGDFAGTIEHSARLLELIPATDHPARVTARALQALAYWALGMLDDAHDTFAAALEHMRSSGQPHNALRGAFVPGDIRATQGRLREAFEIYQSGLRLATEATYSVPPEIDDLYVGLSELHREWNDLDAADRMLTAISETTAYRINRQNWCIAASRVREARGDLEGALALLAEAEAVNQPSPMPRLRPIAAMKARVSIRLGRLADAETWAHARGLTEDDALSYMREYEHITFARLLIARGAADRAVKLLDRLTEAAYGGGRVGSEIETLILRAVALNATGNARGALEPLERALVLAEPQQYLRVFLDEGAAVRELLLNATSRGVAVAQTARVLAGFGSTDSPVAGAGAQTSQLLTSKELVVLRLIAAGLRNQEMAKQLFLSPATVKRHVANIYLKLDVGHRTEALARAKELGLLQD